MPEFPRAHSERALTTKAPRAMRDDADIRNEAAGKAKVMGAAVSEMSKSMAAWTAHVEKVQSDTALFNYKTGLQEISNAAVNDTDMSNEPRYQKALQELKKTVVTGIESDHLKKRMGAELNYMEQVGAIGIQQEFRKKTILHGQAIKMGEMELKADSGDIAGIKAVAKEAIADGTWNELEAYKQERRHISQARENMFISDLNNNPEKAKQGLQQNAYGFTVEELNNAGKVYEREVQVIRDQNENLIIDEGRELKDTDVAGKDALIEKVADQRKKGLIDANFADSKTKELESVSTPKVDSNEADEQANILAIKFASLKKKEAWAKRASFAERAQFRADVLEAKRIGAIDKTTMNDYLDRAAKHFKNDKQLATSLESMFSMSEDLYSNPDNRNVAKAQMVKDLMNKIINDIPPDEALTQVITERVESDYPGYPAERLVETMRDLGHSDLQQTWDALENMKRKKAAWPSQD